MMEGTQSSAIGRAHCSQQLHCRSDELTSTVRDLHEPVNDHRFCMVEFRAGMCDQELYIERNAHALTVAARALRTAAERIEQIAEDAAGQERLDLATVELALAGLGERGRLMADVPGGEEADE